MQQEKTWALRGKKRLNKDKLLKAVNNTNTAIIMTAIGNFSSCFFTSLYRKIYIATFTVRGISLYIIPSFQRSNKKHALGFPQASCTLSLSYQYQSNQKYFPWISLILSSLLVSRSMLEIPQFSCVLTSEVPERAWRQDVPIRRILS